MPQRVADYFVIAGLDFANPHSLRLPGENHNQVAPITDICVLNANEKEQVPGGYIIVSKTVNGNPADLNHGSFNAPCMYICFKRGVDKDPIVGLEVVTVEDSENPDVIDKTPYGHSANVNNATAFSAQPLYIKVRRDVQSPFVITDLVIMLPGKGEEEPLGYSRLNENLNRGMVGTDVFICFKRRPKSVHRASYRPSILTRLPKNDSPDNPMVDCSQFALPSGACVESWPTNRPINSQPEFSTFVLTTETHERIYGASLVFLERIEQSILNDKMKKRLGFIASNNDVIEANKNNEIYMTKAICLLSRHPFFETFEIFLKFLYQMTVSNSIQHLSIEEHVSRFMNLPFPTPRCPRVKAFLSPHHPIHLSLPRYRPLPPSGASFTLLLYNLGTEKVLSLFYHVLTQQKILIHTLNLKDLTPCIEAIAGLIFPLKWQCPFIPLCPIEMATCIESPMPVLMGISTTYFDEKENEPDPETVYIVSLDNGPLPDYQKKFKGLPTKLLNPLKTALTAIEKDLRQLGKKLGFGLDDPDDEDRRQKLEARLRQEFLKFMCSCLQRYRQFLKPIRQRPSTGATDLDMLFNVEKFIKHNSAGSKTSLDFYNLFTQSQAFCMFIEGRTFSMSETAIQQIEYFDDCQDKLVRVSPDSTLIEPGTPNEEDTMKIVLAPEGTGEYEYNMFPTKLVDFVEEKVEEGIRNDGIEKHPGLRTPMELKLAACTAREYFENDKFWPFLLKSYYYGLYFLYLPAYTKTATSVNAAFREGISIMDRMSGENLGLPDEAPIRFLLMSCLEHQKPMTAVRIFAMSKRCLKMEINAATYGLYNKVLLDARWPKGGRDGYTLWRLLRNLILGVTAFMKPINGYRAFQAPVVNSQWNLNMGLQHSNTGAQKSNKACSRTLDGVFEIGMAPSSNTEEVFEPRSSPSPKEDEEVKSDEAKADEDEEDKPEENKVMKKQNSICKLKQSALPKPNLSSNPSEPTDQSDESIPSSLAHSSQDEPNVPNRKNGLPMTDSNHALSEPTISNPGTPEPPLIPAYPKGIQQSRSTWSLPKSMSGTFSDFSVGLNLSNLSKSPTIKSVLSSPSVSKFKEISQSSLNSVKASPSFSNIRDKTNRYLSSATKELNTGIDKLSVAVNKNLQAYYDTPGSNFENNQNPEHEENSSEDSLMDDKGPGGPGRRANSLPRPPRARSLDRLSMKSDATGSIKSQSMPDIIIFMSVASPCTSCRRPLYEEEIMAGWSHDDADYYTKCCWCNKRTTPNITIEINDKRNNRQKRLEFNFMSPVVLRKEIDNLIAEDEDIMRYPQFIDNHETQFWNLLYAFQRINLKHNLDQLIPQSKVLQSEISDEDSGSHSMDSNPAQVMIYLSWDSEAVNRTLNVPPMYRVYKEFQKPQNEQNCELLKYRFDFLKTIVEAIKTNDCHAPLFKILHEFETRKIGLKKDHGEIDRDVRRSCYREALFLLIAAVGQKNIEIPLFDDHWFKAHNSLPSHARDLRVVNDQTPSQRVFHVREYFKERDGQPPALPLLH